MTDRASKHTKFPMADRRFTIQRRPPISCPRCQSRQLQLLEWDTDEVTWRCREQSCHYTWKELDFGGQVRNA